jgi:hypothetical protein
MQGRNPDIFVNSNYIKNNHKVQTKDVLCNPKNPVNPDSEKELWVKLNGNLSGKRREASRLYNNDSKKGHWE